MSLTVSTVWDVRTTGDDTNGGGFDPSVVSPGTDYSQQNAAQVTFTDLVIAATTTNVTSALNPFASTHVGNIINITSGAGFTVGRYTVVSVSGVTATLDRSAGTAASTGGNGKLGGSLLTVNPATQITYTGGGFNTGYTVYVKSGTYTTAAQFTTFASSAPPNFIGYNATHGDGGTAPLFTTATNTVDMFSTSNNNQWVKFTNISFSNTAATRGVCFKQTGGGSYSTVIFTNCILDGFSYAVRGDNSTYAAMQNATFINCEVKNCTVHGIAIWGGVNIVGSVFHDNTGDVIVCNGNFTSSCVYMRDSIFYNTTAGKHFNGTSASLVYSFQVIGCTFFNASSDAITMASGFLVAIGSNNTYQFQLENNIFYGNGGWAVNPTDSTPPTISCNNAYGSNTSGNTHNITTTGNITLTANPFTSGTNYSLNGTAGGGVACKGAAFPAAFLNTVMTSHLDVGAVQSAGSSGGGSFPFLG